MYLHQPKLPTLVAEEKDGVVELSWEVPDDLPFPMPVEVVIEGKSQRVAMENGTATVKVGNAEWGVDPDQWVLRTRSRR